MNRKENDLKSVNIYFSILTHYANMYQYVRILTGKRIPVRYKNLIQKSKLKPVKNKINYQNKYNIFFEKNHNPVICLNP